MLSDNLCHHMTFIKTLHRNIAQWANKVFGDLLPIRNLRYENSPSKQVLLPAIQVKYNTDLFELHGKQSFDWLADFAAGVYCSDVYYAEIKKGKLYPGGVLYHENKVELESAIFQREYLDKLYMNRELFFTRKQMPEKKYECVIFLDNFLSGNYFHWTLEGLTRLALFLEHADVNVDALRIAIPASAPIFLKASLKVLFPFNERHILEVREPVQLINSYLISFPHSRNKSTNFLNVYDPRAIVALNDRSKDVFLDVKFPKRIFISREKTFQRKVAEEKELCKMWKSSPVVLEDLSVVEQIQLFKEVKVVVASHGAGLTNLIYAQHQPLVIELFPKNRRFSDARCFYQITQTLGIKHHSIVIENSTDQQDLYLSKDEKEIIKGILS